MFAARAVGPGEVLLRAEQLPVPLPLPPFLSNLHMPSMFISSDLEKQSVQSCARLSLLRVRVQEELPRSRSPNCELASEGGETVLRSLRYTTSQPANRSHLTSR